MKYIIITAFVSMLYIPGSSWCQGFHAKYKVTKEVQINQPNSFQPKIPPLEFTGYLYHKNNLYISWLTPNYLDKYPQGRIELEMPVAEGIGFFGYSLNMDSMISIYYKAIDSNLIRLTNYTNASNSQKPYSYNFEPGFTNWTILPESKIVQGLNCQRAQLIRSGGIQWDVWFCSDIPIENGVSNIFNLPGLMVEGYSFGEKTSYSLIYYNMQETFDDAVFWPPLFNQPFKHMGTFRNQQKQ
jgi:GLPGLI family protein